MFPMTSSFAMFSCRNSRNLLLYFKCKSSPFVKDFSRLQQKLGSKTPPTQRHLISPRNNGRSSDPLCFDFVSYSWLSKTRLGSGVRPRLSYRMITKRLPICLPNTRPEKKHRQKLVSFFLGSARSHQGDQNVVLCSSF